MSEGLENCPFCGGESEFWERSIQDGNYESLIVGCKECSANMEVWVPRFSENFERNVQIAKAKLISDWNHRVVTDTNVGGKERTAKVEGNRCTACDNYIRPCMKYCDHCGCRLEWE